MKHDTHRMDAIFSASLNGTPDAHSRGIKMALDVGARNLIAYFDPQLVTNQVGDTYDVKEDRMKEYLKEIIELNNRLKSFQLYQIPRKENTKLDYLAPWPTP
ncbi:UNVERIFIED_CONTAM: hypothetical protein Sradi_4392200 [Sesamum radiatum]|uniref:RNase H type-1 domain-containing protein n=1 Tax=Sesamum radiatum TaxID=300843 RepID=A0AAW2NSP5_SESRA